MRATCRSDTAVAGEDCFFWAGGTSRRGFNWRQQRAKRCLSHTSYYRDNGVAWKGFLFRSAVMAEEVMRITKWVELLCVVSSSLVITERCLAADILFVQ